MRVRVTTASSRPSIAARRHVRQPKTAACPRPVQSQLHAVSGLVSAASASPWSSWSEYVDGPSDEDLGWRTDWDRAMIVGRQVGAGSFGTVHMGVCLSTGKEVAVKVLPKIRGKLTKEKTLEKLAREVEILQRLQGCGGVVQLEDCFEDTDNVRIVTELCAGGDLQKFAEDHGALNERSLALVAVEVLKIVKACHDAGLLHGDVKPANFCLKSKLNNPLVNPDLARSGATPQHWLKAIDFGCSQMLPAGGRRLSKRTGTPVYMAPEIFNRDYHREADVWSIGVMLYQLCSRRFPFWESVESCRASKLEEVAQAVQEADISYSYGPWLRISHEGREFVDGCLTRNVRRRMTIDEALSHPWLARALSVDTAGSAIAVSASGSGNNIVATTKAGVKAVAAAVTKMAQVQDVPAAA